jgi:hypothetical protein
MPNAWYLMLNLFRNGDYFLQNRFCDWQFGYRLFVVVLDDLFSCYYDNGQLFNIYLALMRYFIDLKVRATRLLIGLKLI